MILIKPTTTAKTSKQFVILRNERVSVHAAGLSEGEEITINLISNGVPLPLKLIDETPITLTFAVPMLGLPYSGTYTVTKPITSNPVSVSID